MLAIVFPKIDPVLLHIYGPISIRWYSLAYIFGIMIGTWLLYKFNKNDSKRHFNKKALEDLILYSTLGIIIGGRVGNTFIYDYDYFLSDPFMILRIWEGGMSFHGGTTGLIIAIYILCKKHNLEFLYCLDLIACVAPIGIFLGRIANFINAELYGRVTDLPWGVVFPNAGNITRHPSQIYEALTEGMLLFGIMILFRCKTNYNIHNGRLAGIFMVGYAFFRYIMEEFREPDYHSGLIMGNYTIGQILSIPIFIAGVFLILYSTKISYFNKSV